MWSMIGADEFGVECIYETYPTREEAEEAMEEARADEPEFIYRVELYEDDDPICVCGTARSEHSMMGCHEGFQTAEEWEREREFIAELDDDMYERIYHPYGY